MKSICLYCGKEFEAKRKDKRYCSLRCKRAVIRIIFSPESGIHICKNCGKEYYYEKGQGNWLKDNSIGLKKGNVSSIDFCCYSCGKEYRNKKAARTKEERYEDSKYNNIDRIKKTNLKKYGVECCLKNKEIIAKRNATNRAKYGVDYPLQNKEIHHKTVENLKKNDPGFKKLIEKRKITIYKTYHTMHPSQSEQVKEKTKQTNLEKYGIQNTFQLPDVKEKLKAANQKKYGVNYAMQNEEFKQKHFEQRRKNGTLNTSKPEKEILELLKIKFPEVEYQYRSEKYPFYCDFYIPDLDLYIEYQGFWSHGGKPFEGTPEDLERLKKLKNENRTTYIDVWTVRDPLKRETARKNGLNWIEFFNMKEFKDWYDTV